MMGCTPMGPCDNTFLSIVLTYFLRRVLRRFSLKEMLLGRRLVRVSVGTEVLRMPKHALPQSMTPSACTPLRRRMA